MIYGIVLKEINGVRCQVSAQPPAKKTTSQIEKETLKKRISNIEYRIMNIECRRNEFCLFYKKMTERSETTLRHSIFCGSLFNFLKFHASTAAGLTPDT